MPFDIEHFKKHTAFNRPTHFHLEIDGWEQSKLLFYRLKLVNGRVMEAACYDDGKVLENLKTIAARIAHDGEVTLKFTSFGVDGAKIYEFEHSITRMTYSTIFDWEEVGQIVWWKLEFPVT